MRQTAHSGPMIVSDGIVACWDAAGKRSYPGTGTTWYDMSGNGNDGTLTNGPTFDAANDGSIDFDGTDDKVGLGDQKYDLATCTISAWVKLDAFSGGDGSDSRIVCNGSNDTNYWSLTTTGGAGLICFANSTSSHATASSDFNLSLSRWYYVLGIRGPSTEQLYVDGVLQSALNTISWSTTAGTWIGQRGDNARQLNGKVADVRIYDRNLTAAEVRQNYNATKGRFI